jgi:exosome complex component RRP4
MDTVGRGMLRHSRTYFVVVTPAELITGDVQFMRGHGTYMEGTKMFSAIAGRVEKVNKLVSVHALKTRYIPEIGDIVIGRVVEVGFKRWKVDIQSKLNATLLLSSITLPGGIQVCNTHFSNFNPGQRRKQEEDELNMRAFFAEGDLLVVRAVCRNALISRLKYNNSLPTAACPFIREV